MYGNDYEKEVIAQIEYSRELYKKQKIKVMEEEHIKDLLFHDYIGNIKKNTSRYDVLDDVFAAAQKELRESNGPKEPLSENCSIIYTNMIGDFFDGDTNFKLKDITALGYDSCAWLVYFEGHGINLYIQIPMMRKLNYRNIQHASWGQIGFIVNEGPITWNAIKESYSIKEIKDIIKEYLDELEESREIINGAC